jgi:thiamine-phosphate diphosphorylase
MMNVLYLVTNRKLVENNDFYGVINESVKHGVDAVILREKDLEVDELYELASNTKKITDKYNTPLIINSNINVAKKISAYGIHLSFNYFINNKIEYDGKIGVSVHNLEEAIMCEKLGADYILAGHIFPTDCKKNLAPRGLDFLENIRKNISIPLIAIGGINEYNIKDIYNVGADGAAVMSLIMQSTNIQNTINKLKAVD